RDPPSTHLVRVTPPGVNLDLLSRLHALLGRIDSQRLGADEIDRELEAIERAPALYGWPARVVSFAVAGAAAAVFFGGGRGEVMATAAIGLVVSLLVWVTSGHARTRALTDMAAALVATVLA